MSGLILAGIGRGLSDAASTFGNVMLRKYEADQAMAREEARDARKLKAAEDREEQLKQRMISEIAAAREGGAQIGRERVAGQVQAIGSQVAGDSPVMEQSEIAALLKENPQYEEIYRKSGIIKDAMDPRLQQATDQYDAAVGAGAHSSVLDSLEKTRKTVLDQIREENRDKAERTRQEQTDRRLDQTDRRLDEMVTQNNRMFTLNQQRTDAATSRATGAGGVTEDQITRAENALSTAEDRAGRRFREPTIQEKSNPTAAKAYQDEKNRFIDNDPNVKRQRDRLERLYSGEKTATPGAPAPRPGPVKPGDNNNANRPPLQSFMR